MRRFPKRIINKPSLTRPGTFDQHGNTRRGKVKALTMLMFFILFASYFIVPRAVCAGDIYVSYGASCFPIPCNGSPQRPYPWVNMAIEEASPGDNIWIGAGIYDEEDDQPPFTISKRCILRSTGGSVFIGGEFVNPSSTSLDILTLNTLLFGGAMGPNWQDTQRAYDIGDTINILDPEVVGLQEVWDSGRLTDLFSASGRNYKEYGSYDNCHLIDTHNSGLAILSEYPLNNFEQVCWDSCSDTQCFASKGYVRATIEKDGFQVTVFNLHTQAYPTATDSTVRRAQIEQLKGDVEDWRSTHRGHVVFVMGDFNIIGESGEYWDTLKYFLGGIGGYDAFPRGPATYSKSNRLAKHIANFTLGINYPFPPNDQRLDYIFYFPSLDGLVSVVVTDIEVYKFRGSELSGCTSLFPFGEHCLNDCQEKSDHWSVRGQFQLVRQ